MHFPGHIEELLKANLSYFELHSINFKILFKLLDPQKIYSHKYLFISNSEYFEKLLSQKDKLETILCLNVMTTSYNM